MTSFRIYGVKPSVALCAVFSAVTAIGLILGGYGILLRNSWLLLASFLLDAADGWLARQLNVVTDFGAKFDRLGDCVLAQTVIWIYFPARPVLSVILLAAQCASLSALGHEGDGDLPRHQSKWTGRSILSVVIIVCWQMAWL